MNNHRVQLIRERLANAFGGAQLEIVDESHMHIGHAGARDGKGHFRIRIVSECFQGHRRLHRHRLIFAALTDLMQTDIHALRIEALTPDEVGPDLVAR